MTSVETVLATLGKRGPQAQVLAAAVCALVIDGAEHEMLTERQILADGEPRTVRLIPLPWFDRLARAIEGGALGKMSAQAIADRILSTEAPEAA